MTADPPAPAEPPGSAEPPAARPLVIVDAANVVGSRPDGWWRDRPGATARLLRELVTDPGSDTLVVLEGAARGGHDPGMAGSVLVAHAPGSGDDEMVRLAGAAVADGRTVTVVTSDRGLRERVTALGASVAGPRSVRP